MGVSWKLGNLIIAGFQLAAGVSGIESGKGSVRALVK